MFEDADNPNRLLEENKEDGRFQLRPDIQLHLYISDSPCGDASIYPIVAFNTMGDEKEEMLFAGAKVVVSEETRVDANACAGNHQLLEGRMAHTVAREEIQVLGKLRTKLGRSHLPAHLSSSTRMSCSDKIVQWSVLGLQRGLLSKYVVAPIQLSSVVVSRDPRLGGDNIPVKEQEKVLKLAIHSRSSPVGLGPCGPGKEWKKEPQRIFYAGTIVAHCIAIICEWQSRQG
jgi:hypothetical protein